MALLKYSVLRIVFVLVCAFGLKLAGAQGALLWLLAIIFGMLLSFLLLRSERDDVTATLSERREKRLSGMDKVAQEDADFEDNL